MGEQKVKRVVSKKDMHQFVHHLLQDVNALEYMLENDWFENDITRIGAEQEMCLVEQQTYKPAPYAMEVIEKMGEPAWLDTELAKFNLEVNLEPRVFTGDCFEQMESEIRSTLGQIKKVVNKMDAEILLTGILPTLRKFDLEMHNLTPKQRYYALMEAINSQLRQNGAYELRLVGIDELLLKHDSPLLEACNTSFQVHLQVNPQEFKNMYNISQALCAPTMAMAANSPVVFGKRLWHETRIALFQQAIDTRSTYNHMRERSPRVNFGTDWMNDSILDIYKEDISRFRVLLGGEVSEDSYEKIRNGEVPKLKALQIHNSTVYRWNRPCYGISDTGKPHLRIENRILPAGPTVIDEMANAAFWLGCMQGMGNQVDDIRKHLSFDDVRDNFGKAARFGIDTKFTWDGDNKITAKDLMLKELLPIAKEGLKSMKVSSDSISKYLDVIEERVESHSNGARWILRSVSKLSKETSKDEAITAVTAAILENQSQSLPVHKWKLPELSDLKYYHPMKLRVDEIMHTDLFTVQKDDSIELVSEMMDWRKVRYAPVEDDDGNLQGLVTSRRLLRHFTQQVKGKPINAAKSSIEDIMIKNPVTVSPDTNILEAMGLMRINKVGCLPVILNEELIGMVSELELLQLTGRLMRRMNTEEEG